MPRVPPEAALAQRRAVFRLFDFTDDFGPSAEALVSVRLAGLSVCVDMNSHGMEIDASLASLLVRDVLRYKYVAVARACVGVGGCSCVVCSDE